MDLPARLPELVAAGLSDQECADHLDLSRSTVIRLRRAHGLRSRWTPPAAPHGSLTRYERGCACGDCRGANAARQARARARAREATRLAPRAYEPWTPDDDATLYAAGWRRLTTTALALGRSRAACEARLTVLLSREAATH